MDVGLVLFIFGLYSLFMGALIGYAIGNRNTSINYNIDGHILETAEYNPKKDLLAVFVGDEDNIPPQETIEEITKVLEKVPKCNLLIAPGFFRILVLKGQKLRKTRKTA